MLSAFAVMNVVGLLAFAVTGSLKAIDEQLDVLGVFVLGTMIALGGGMTRDVLVGAVPNALQSTDDVTIALAGVVLAIFLSRTRRNWVQHSAILVPDAIGLAAFAATGALVGAEAGVSGFGVVLLATLTGVGGGLISDVLLQRVPGVLKEDFYATCAVAGGVVFWAVSEGGAGPDVAAAACAATVLALRLLALRFDWSLPRVSVS
ncbi:trimeric intracellular cation channel family protein [Haladaptatus sp. GCM10025707]|uniref:trimeric intracellular cation channel family protein n=1 Tax=unclassified Haladaptatus TaxID=2622732 RepID=UPI0023E7D418|nr:MULTISPECIES: trimeric intracellular cation channel family protein [unclassified Haladaptatus]